MSRIGSVEQLHDFASAHDDSPGHEHIVSSWAFTDAYKRNRESVKKMPTLYVRDPEDRAHVTDEVTPGCEWVLAGEGTPRHKFDGTAVMYDNHEWWSRREVKPGKDAPKGFELVETDETTGKQIGWEPIENSGFHKHFLEALDAWLGAHDGVYPFSGSYELCGPKISNKKGVTNPENLEGHRLLRHDTAETIHDVLTRSVDEELTVAFRALDSKQLVRIMFEHYGWEGIVWYHENGAMVKLKARDLS